MQCSRCHHTHEAHSASGGTENLGLGGCGVPGCTCDSYRDPVPVIDEDLL